MKKILIFLFSGIIFITSLAEARSKSSGGYSTKSYLGELKTWTEFKEALPKLQPELLHYTVVHYYFAWHRCKGQLFDTNMFQKFGFYYQFRYSKEKYRKIFYYICYPHIIKSGDKVEQYKLFDLTSKLKLIK